MFKSIRHVDVALITTGFLLTFLSSPGQTFFISLFKEHIQDSYQISNTVFGAIYSLATLSSAVVILWSGALVDRWPLPKIIFTALAGLCAGLCLLAYGNHLAFLALALFALRHFGQGLMMLIASSSIVRYIDHYRGKAIALSGMGYISAEALLPSAVILMLSIFAWDNALAIIAASIALIFTPLFLTLLSNHSQRDAAHQAKLERISTASKTALTTLNVAEPEKQKAPKHSEHWNRQAVLRDPPFYLLMPLMLAHPMIFTGLIFFQLDLVAEKGWSLPLWGTLFALYAGVGMLSKLITGFLIDTFSAVKLIPINALPLAIALIALTQSADIIWAYLFMICLGLTTGIQSTLSAPLWAECYGSQHIGAIKSLISFSVVISTAVTPLLLGWLLDSGATFDLLAQGFLIYLTASAAMATLGRSRIKKRLKERAPL